MNAQKAHQKKLAIVVGAIFAIAFTFQSGVYYQSLKTKDVEQQSFSAGYSKMGSDLILPEGQKWERCNDDKWCLVPETK